MNKEIKERLSGEKDQQVRATLVRFQKVVQSYQKECECDEKDYVIYKTKILSKMP